MSLYSRVAMISDIPELIDFEKKKLVDSISDEMEREMTAWNSRWREESLNHYLPLGWSFLIRDKDQPSIHSTEGLLVGYFIAQPLLFFDGQTQTLWVEHLQHSSLQARDQLCDLAYRMSREKHFQKVLFPNSDSILNSIKQMRASAWEPPTLEVKTTKV